jgi:hypothetical protein
MGLGRRDSHLEMRRYLLVEMCWSRTGKWVLEVK